MQLSNRILSDITVHMKYAKFLPILSRRESWEELVTRNKTMQLKKYPTLAQEIEETYKFVYNREVLPSMRSLQFAGKPIQLNPVRIYNCSFLPMNHPVCFNELMFLLLSGVGVGYSVQRDHVEEIPEVWKPRKTRRYLVGDSIEGWADAVKVLMAAYFSGKALPNFDFSDIRPKGAALITSGGKAPGSEPLKECLFNIQKMLESKFGNWYETEPQRARANNSAVILRHKIDKDTFLELWKKIEASNAGEPGFFFSNDVSWGLNPCGEVSLRPFQFCNLTTINASNVRNQQDLNDRARAAAFLGTLQAGYTNFHYLRDVWKKTTEKEALIGVSMTGIASGAILELNLTEAANIIKEENARVATLIGINKAARTTVVKPEGTSSLVVGSSSGVHAWHDEYYWRRMRVGKNEAIYTYLMLNHPELLEDDYFKPHTQAIISVPQKAPVGAITRSESALDLLNRVSHVWKTWIKPGHRKGSNMNNVSTTITIKPEEWTNVGEWMWTHRNEFTALSVLPYDGGSYVQAPFESCTKDEYEEAMRHLNEIDLTQVVEMKDETTLQNEVACGGGACVIT